jgi:hypothetical protein
MRRRGSKRSTNAPAATEKSRNGNQCDTTAKPRAQASGISETASSS